MTVRAQKSLEFEAPVTTPALTDIAPTVAAHERPEKLWLAVYLQALALDVFAGDASDPLAVVDGTGSKQTVVAVNTPAREAGIRAGHTLNAAYALAPELNTVERNMHREQAALTRLAGWAGQFTSDVSIDTGDVLLLEVRGSVKLFGGLDRLLERIRDGLAVLGYQVRLSVAPTPLAARWLARAGDGHRVLETACLPGALGPLPVSYLDWPDNTLQALSQIGVTRVRDCLRLPRDGFARRFGRARLAELDRALGRLPDPRNAFEPPARFDAALELPAEVDDVQQAGFALNRLVQELAGFLRARDSAVDTVTLTLHHREQTPTPVLLKLTQPARDPLRLMALLNERLDQLSLPAPVYLLALSTGAVRPFQVVLDELFGRGCVSTQAADEQTAVLIDRLRARLGRDAVYGICPVPDHRPEAAWRQVEPGVATDVWPQPPRPLWLLARPLALAVYDGRPDFGGALHYENGPERIESGWWDGGDVARDYYVVRNAKGVKLWIYRRRESTRRADQPLWFLHGVFG